MKWLNMMIVTAFACGMVAVASAKYHQNTPQPAKRTMISDPRIQQEPMMDFPAVPAYVRNLPTPPATDELDTIIGIVSVVGTTYFDYFSNGNTNRLIATDTAGGIHTCWMKCDSLGGNRAVYYNFYSPTAHRWGNTTFPLGQSVFTGYGSGYCDIDVLSNGNAVVAAHRPGTSIPSHSYTSTIGVDDGYQTGAYVEHPIGYPSTATSADSGIWPAVVIDKANQGHIFAMNRTTSSFIHPFFYARTDTLTHSQLTPAPAFIDPGFGTATIGIYSATSRGGTSNRVAVAWSQNKLWPTLGGWAHSLGYAQNDNDLYYAISEDGGTNWNFDSPTNVTQFVGWQDTTFYGTGPYAGDSIACAGDTTRFYNDACMIFDNNNRLHIVFITRGFYEDGTVDTATAQAAPMRYIWASMCQMWHWCEDSPDQFTRVADGWFTMGNYGYNANSIELAWQLSLSRPSLSIDNTGNLYCVWTQYDAGDVANNGMACGDVYATHSTDNGVNWYKATNLTNTGNDTTTLTGSAANEMFACAQEVVTNDSLYISYLYRTEGGVAVNPITGTTPLWTNNSIKVQRVPVSALRNDEFLPDTVPMWSELAHHYTFGVRNVADRIPNNFKLEANYPNPFNPTTDIVFSLDKTRNIQIAVYDVTGRQVAKLANGNYTAGRHTVSFNGQNHASGVYFVRLSANGLDQTRKITLLK